MTVQGVYDTDAESHTFASMEGYREYLEQKSAITSATAMFQQELNKASGYGAGGVALGLLWSAGGGLSNQNARRDQSSNFGARSQAKGRLNDKNTQTYMALLEINVFRYEIFMDDVKPADLNLAFLRDFLNLPVSYFSIRADQYFQNFIIRYGTHYIKSAKFGGQLKIIKTKEASKELSIQSFSEKAQTEWKKAFSTFSAEASQTKSSSLWHEHETKTESQNAEGEASEGSDAAAKQSQTENLHSFEFSNEMIVVQGGDQRIAAAITEMYTTSLSTELKTWLESIKDYPKAFSFIMKPITAVLDINFDSIFPNGAVDLGCLGKSELKVEDGTGRKYYVQETKQTVGNTTQDISEVRYCDFKGREEFAEKVTKRRLALGRAIAVYLEEGPLLSTDFLLPAGEPGCETATLAYLDDRHSGSPTWAELERPHVWLGFQFNSILSLHYYAFGSGMYPVKVMGVSLVDQTAQDYIICREGTEKDDGRCKQRCHPECDECHSFCQDVSSQGTRVCTGPNSNQCNTCKYTVDGVCSVGCSPGQKAVKQSDDSFQCDKCRSGYKCERGDELEEICPAGTYSNQDRTGCGQCPAGGIFPQRSPAGTYKYNFDEARQACAEKGATLASYKQLEDAWKNGLDYCACGWLSNRNAGYPTQIAREGCGEAKINMCAWRSTWDAWCFPIVGGIFPQRSPAGTYKYNFDEARQACAEKGATLASYKQLEDAWKNGLDHCACGWLSNRNAGYPTQIARKGCGEAKINICALSSDSGTWDAWCFPIVGIYTKTKSKCSKKV
uniref:MACPF domain-containing protein n=1 Tax=Branchiostoma floridae TaxID=7739 RepID=C3ZUI3_BRAFL|eukprot:XP_002587811.1 hypothetical protein BRAFLDRAFT_92260 [Branchiostoma floridae]